LIDLEPLFLNGRNYLYYQVHFLDADFTRYIFLSPQDKKFEPEVGLGRGGGPGY